MHRLLSILLLLAAFFIFTSCQKPLSPSSDLSDPDDGRISEASISAAEEKSNPEIPDTSLSEPEDSEPLSPPLDFRVTDVFFPQCFQKYMVPPSLLYGEYIISNPYGENSRNTYAVSADSRSERDLGFYGWDVKADADFYYWMDCKLMDVSGALTKTNKITLESTVLLKLEGERNIFPRLSMSGNHIVWVEGVDVEHYYIMVYDIKEHKLDREIPVNYYYHPTAAPELCGDWLIYVEIADDRYQINCLDLTGGEHWRHAVSEGQDNEPLGTTEDGRPIFWSSSEPIGIATDGKRLFWSSMEGIFCCEGSDGEEQLIREGPLGTDVALLMDRYLVYGYDFNMYVYDTATAELIFSGEPEGNTEYGGFFNVSENAESVVFQGWDRDDPETCFIAELGLEKAER